MELFVSTSSAAASCTVFDSSHPNLVERKKKKETMLDNGGTKNTDAQHLSFNSAVGEHWLLCETRTPVIASSNSLYRLNDVTKLG